MNVGRIFVGAVLRRVALFLVVGGLAWFGIGTARAAPGGEVCSPGGAGHPCTQQTAYEYCMAWVTEKVASTGGGHTGPVCTARTSTTWRAGHTTLGYVQDYNGSRDTFAFIPCPSGTTWDEASHTCKLACPGGFSEDPANPGQCMTADKCKAKPALGNAFTIGGSGTTCVDGCQFAPPVSVCSNGVCAVSGAIGTGAACGVGDLPPQQNKDQQCTPAGSGQTYCVKSDGRQCYSAGNGRQVCWRPGETGEKPDNDVLQKRDAGTEPVAPNVNLPNNDTLTPKDSPVVSNTQVKDGSGTRNITTVTQNYGTVNGTNAGSGNQGENGDGTGGGEGDGEGDGEGSPGEGVGDLYEGEGRTVSEVFGEFKQRVTNAPIASAGTQFFTVSVGGSCPTWTVPASDYWRAMVFDFHCSQTMLQAFAWGAMLLMAVAAFVAFKWGFL